MAETMQQQEEKNKKRKRRIIYFLILLFLLLLTGKILGDMTKPEPVKPIKKAKQERCEIVNLPVSWEDAREEVWKTRGHIPRGDIGLNYTKNPAVGDGIVVEMKATPGITCILDIPENIKIIPVASVAVSGKDSNRLDVGWDSKIHYFFIRPEYTPERLKLENDSSDIDIKGSSFVLFPRKAGKYTFQINITQDGQLKENKIIQLVFNNGKAKSYISYEDSISFGGSVRFNSKTQEEDRKRFDELTAKLPESKYRKKPTVELVSNLPFSSLGEFSATHKGPYNGGTYAFMSPEPGQPPIGTAEITTKYFNFEQNIYYSPKIKPHTHHYFSHCYNICPSVLCCK